jgi:hypothetical protein
MILRTSYLLAAAAFFSLASADVEVVSPQAGDSITGLNLEIEWKDSGNTPPLSQLANYQLFLCAGGNDDSNYVRIKTQDTVREKYEADMVHRFNSLPSFRQAPLRPAAPSPSLSLQASGRTSRMLIS